MKSIEFIYGDTSLPEFEDMFGGWLTEHDGRTFLVDCGVATGGASMAARLKERLGGRPLDYVLLTHIHMDHAGGLEDILKAWPEIKILAHAKGVPHLISPSRLWAGTKEVMGERVAAMYGRPVPIDPARLIPHTEADLPGLKIIETPGHAPHHLSFRLGQTMFVGEAGGCPEIWGGRIYVSPASPPKFFPEVTRASVDLLLEEADGPAYFGHTHYPMPLHETLHIRNRQLARWEELLRRPESARRPDETRQGHLDRLIDLILAEDHDHMPPAGLSPDALERHRYFTGNNLEGFLGYLEYEAQQAQKAG